MNGYRGTPSARLVDDYGGVSVVGASLLLVVTVSAVAVIAASSLLAQRHALAAAADSAALAGADAASGLAGGDPCTVAAHLAEAVGARLEACLRDGSDVSVRVTRATGPLILHAGATAGQPSQPSVGSKQ